MTFQLNDKVIWLHMLACIKEGTVVQVDEGSLHLRTDNYNSLYFDTKNVWPDCAETRSLLAKAISYYKRFHEEGDQLGKAFEEMRTKLDKGELACTK